MKIVTLIKDVCIIITLYCLFFRPDIIGKIVSEIQFRTAFLL